MKKKKKKVIIIIIINITTNNNGRTGRKERKARLGPLARFPTTCPRDDAQELSDYIDCETQTHMWTTTASSSSALRSSIPRTPCHSPVSKVCSDVVEPGRSPGGRLTEVGQTVCERQNRQEKYI